MRTLFALLFFCTFVSAQSPRPAVEAVNGMVVCVCPIAADVGVNVLKGGGNAVDAAVAVAFAEAVTWPEAGNIGGGGFMLVDPGSGKEPTFFDYRETAPALATKTLFADGKTDWTSHKAVGVPGTVRGMELAHKRFGTKPWKELVMPAVLLAENGFLVDAPLARRLNGIFADGKSNNAEFRRVYSKPKWKTGDRMTLPDLGKTLRAIAESGPDAFYTGELAGKLEAEMQAHGGLITRADLAAYKAIERKPLRGTYRGYELIAPPPPSSGGIAIIEALNILEQFDIAKTPRTDARTIHRIAEAQRRAFADRARYLGDPDFTEIPGHLVSKEHAKTLAASIDATKATQSETLTPEIAIRDSGTDTTHFSIVDKNGMAVSNTYTLENSFGSRIVVPGLGYILNNEMTDFNPIPGITTRSGKIGTEPNTVAPGKRMLSSMAPMMVRKDGKLFLVTGSPGGRTIINTVLCVMINVLDYDMDVQAAVDAPRQHHQWFPDRLAIEDFLTNDTAVSRLKAMGHDVVGHKQGDAHTIRIDPKTGRYQGAADTRLNGKAAGY